MNTEERKRFYNKLIDGVSELHKEISADSVDNSSAINEVSQLINQSNDLIRLTTPNDHVNNTAEVVMDAQVMQMGHEIVGEIVNRVCTLEFSTEEYCAAIQSRFGGNGSVDWNTLASVVAGKFAAHKNSICLLGSFKNESPEVVQKAARARQPKSAPSVLVQPEDVKKVEPESQSGKNLNIFLSKIAKVFITNKKQPIPYYKVIIDPADFMQTIDNAFQVAFLVSNGSAVIEEDEDGMPVVRPVLDKSESNSKKVPVQAVSNVTMRICQDMAKRYNIREPLIK
ncbi:unnamed protein product [Hermetia illucens]|uniref:Non-structural maintenance of chromosomes element 4 n=1 Tax=Hermetia illucens TaxID=343691 RepID=A0A7R8UAY0_HERIL|nr:non-structural maintenance of chromosomes element 4 homolog A-like [Hermetia illucens]CAD7077414.1 unnamed protein product [Hermetia illucens]